MASDIESGLQLLERLCGKSCPVLNEIDDTLFFDGLRSRDIVEINGNASSGKTLLLCQLLAKCILPTRYGEVRVGGCQAYAILINTDHHFQVSRLVEIMEEILSESLGRSNVQVIDVVIRESLDKLMIIDSYNSDQFSLTLHMLEKILFERDNETVTLLAFDGILSYYWQDKENKGIRMFDLYVKNLIKNIQSHMFHSNVVIIYTSVRDVPFAGDAAGTHTTDSIAEKIRYRIQMSKVNGSKEFLCFVKSARSTRELRYTLDTTGIKWKRDGKSTV